jgi:hypothetical protein
MKTLRLITVILLTAQFFNIHAVESEKKIPEWPRKLDTGTELISIYQPQVNSLEGDMLDARAAISVKKKGEGLVFGAMWFTSRLITDFDTRLVSLEDVKIQAVKFPEADENQEKSMIAMLESKLPGMDPTLSLDRLLASLDMEEKSNELSEQLSTTAPNILYEDEAAVLVFIDGDPILENIENSNLKYVANTPYFIIYNTSDTFFYLKGGKWWYRAGRVENTWRNIDNPPMTVREIAEQLDGTYDTDVDSIARTMKTPPKIVLSKEPAELIITDGSPDFANLEGSSLLYVRNTENEILMDIETQDYYTLVSGRWYKSKSLDKNDWASVDPTGLPEEFAQIQAKSEIGSVRASIPGTQEAKEAILENEIPQTAVIDRNKADVIVEYDGQPEFQNINGTKMSYAVNTDKSVILIGNRYYAVDNAVWYVSGNPSGPWNVCVEVPQSVYTIPPSYPVYNMKYVYIYDYTPDVVYVGYTPGYYHSYRYRGTIVYGTGYHYSSWYRKHYYPRHMTYGFGVHYHPFTGWGFSTGVSYGWVGYRYYRPYYHTSWWGPSGYRYGYRHGYYNGFNRGYYKGYYHGYNYGVYTSSRSGYASGYRDGYHYTSSHNLYKNSRSNNVISTGTRPTTYGSRASTTRTKSSYSSPRTTDRKNNVYTDREGNVYRQKGDTWQERTDGSWKKSDTPVRTRTGTESTQRIRTTTERTRTTTTGNATNRTISSGTSRTSRNSSGNTRPNSTITSRTKPSSSGSTLNRESNARSQGSQRTNIYQKSKQPTKKSTNTRSSSGRSSKQPVKRTTTSSSGRGR